MTNAVATQKKLADEKEFLEDADTSYEQALANRRAAEDDVGILEYRASRGQDDSDDKEKKKKTQSRILIELAGACELL